ncbi:uncharacterized protein [Henckelia pumila]|uniref:uncharacterized protein n=1 Tax=Henckelia pumila TaxID=405737 RepID=UPI003C6DC84B
MGRETKVDEEMEFPAFPYEPYSIQLDFMKFLYQSLDRGGISMLESPTGTGKTLSIICSSLQWLVDRKNLDDSKCNEVEELGDGSGVDNDEPDWMRTFVPNKVHPPESDHRKGNRNGVRLNPTRVKREKEEFMRDLFNTGEEVGNNSNKEVKIGKTKGEVDEVDDAEFLLQEYDSGREDDGILKRTNSKVDILSSEDEEEADGLGEKEEVTRMKIYFCSRTHSQLSQFISELKKTKFASELKVVCLGSRKNLCINEEVLKLGNSTRINERCSELQKNKKDGASKMKKVGAEKGIHRKKGTSGCPMLRRRKTEEFKNVVIQQEPLDIEDLVRVGLNIGSCPYYGSRKIMPTADLVILPYQSLLSKSSRESLGLSLKNSVIIIDEAHNLADTLVSMYDAKITLHQLTHLRALLDGYFKRFCKLLGPGNRRYIQIFMVLTRAFSRVLCNDIKDVNNVNVLSNTEDSEGAFDSSMAINEFLFALNIDNINLVKLSRYIKESNIIYKVSGYGDKISFFQKGATVTDGEIIGAESAISGFRALADMLFSLTNNDIDGKVIISRQRQTCNGQGGGYIKYVMLNGERIFSQVVNQARAVILTGGTLQPIEETKERLFPSLPQDQLQFFSCGHIIPSENILPVAVKHGPSGQPLDFSFKSRSSPTMIEELGLLLSNIVTVVPEGVVVFFSSFDYEGRVYDSWKASGILSRIMKKKRVFREPRKNTDVEAVLREYKETIHALSLSDPISCNGAILLAVVGGKISEGINFSDGTGRCIVMVGLPYPNPSDIELIERVKHIEGFEMITPRKNARSSFYDESLDTDVETGFHILKLCKGRGKDYYENLCMKAVNQSIGRAIRHVNDYAAILLVDARYASGSNQRNFSHSTDKLPQWIKSHLVTRTKNYGEVHRLLHQFFKFHKNK